MWWQDSFILWVMDGMCCCWETEDKKSSLGLRGQPKKFQWSLCNVWESTRFKREGKALASDCKTFWIAMWIIFLLTSLIAAYESAIMFSKHCLDFLAVSETVSTSRMSEAINLPEKTTPNILTTAKGNATFHTERKRKNIQESLPLKTRDQISLLSMWRSKWFYCHEQLYQIKREPLKTANNLCLLSVPWHAILSIPVVSSERRKSSLGH